MLFDTRNEMFLTAFIKWDSLHLWKMRGPE